MDGISKRLSISALEATTLTQDRHRQSKVVHDVNNMCFLKGLFHDNGVYEACSSATSPLHLAHIRNLFALAALDQMTALTGSDHAHRSNDGAN